MFLQSANVLNVINFTTLSIAQTVWRRIVERLVNDGLESMRKGARGLVSGNIPKLTRRD
jgi:hypothetical protein